MAIWKMKKEEKKKKKKEYITGGEYVEELMWESKFCKTECRGRKMVV